MKFQLPCGAGDLDRFRDFFEMTGVAATGNEHQVASACRKTLELIPDIGACEKCIG